MGDKIDWIDFSRKNLSEDVIRSLKDKLNFSFVFRYSKLSEQGMEEFATFPDDWTIISRYQTLTEIFIEKHLDDVCWDTISRYQILTTNFIIKHIDKINWDNISRYQKLSPDFINIYQDYINMIYASQYQILPIDLIQKFSDRVDWEKIVQFQTFDEDFILENIQKINVCHLIKFKLNLLSDEFFDLHYKKIVCVLIANICNRVIPFIDEK